MTARQTRRGVSVRIGPKRKVIRNTFLARMPSGHIGVFSRRGNGRLPIDELFTIAISEAFSSKKVAAAMQAKAATVFMPNFQHALEHFARQVAPEVVLNVA